MTAPLTPTWLAPTAPGLLSNRRGSDFANDAIAFSTRYRHPLGATADSPSALQVKAYRTVSKGTPQAPELVWDSGVQGNFGFGAPAGLPAPVNSGPGGVPSYPVCQVNLSATAPYNTRVYATFGTYHVYSAPVAGSGLGAWRLEIDLQGLPTFVNPPIQIMQVVGDLGTTTPPVMTLHVFSAGATSLVHNRLAIAADGTLSVVAALDPVSLSTVATFQQVGLGGGWGPGGSGYGWALTQPTAILCGAVWGLQAASNVVHLITFDGTGAIVAISAALSPLTTALRGVAIVGWHDTSANPVYYILGGDTGAASVSTIYVGTVTNPSNDQVTSVMTWTTGATGLPAARARHAATADQAFSWQYSGSPQPNWFYVLGGQLTGATQSTIYYINTANIGTGAWSTSAVPLPSATQDVGAIGLGVSDTALGVFGGTFAQITSMGSAINSGTGANGAWNVGAAAAMTAATVGGAKRTVADGVLNSTTTVTSATAAFVAGDAGRPIFGAGIPFGATILTINSGTSVVISLAATATASGVSLTIGSGGTFTINPDGSADIGFVYGGFGSGNAATIPLSDGDQIQVSVQFYEKLVGDGSPTSITTVKVGQPPTITGQSTGVTVAKPTLTLYYVGGAGGAGELSYSVVVRKHSDSSLAFDSGVVKGAANTVLVQLAPYLLNATQYDITYTVVSTDIPIDGNSSNTGTATGTVTPAYGTAPLQPTALAATADAANGWFRLTWTDPGGTRTAWRIYYRRNGGTWVLYQDAVPLASNAGINLMDELVPGASYDFAVSGINGVAGESALSTPVLAVVLSPTAWTAMLHVAGAGATAGNAVGLVVGAPPAFIDHTERTHLIGFGQRAGATRWGPADWHSIALVVSLLGGAAGLRALIALLNQAQTGTPLYYRDAYGHMFVVSPTPGWQAAMQPKTQIPDAIRYVTLSLDEIANTYAASVASGSALGMRGQSAGSIVPLDLAETAA